MRGFNFSYRIAVMNKPFNKKTPILTMGEVEYWRTLRDQKIMQRQVISAEISDLDQKLVAAAFFMKEAEKEPSPPTAATESDDDENMADAAKRIIGLWKGPKQPDNQDVQTELKKIERFREMLDRNPNYYYTMMSRLIKRGEISRRYKRFTIRVKNEVSEETP